MKSRKPNRPPDPVVEARSRGQFVAHAVSDGEHRRRSRRKQQARAPPDDDDNNDHHDGAFSIRAFCARHSISQSFFHKLRSLGLGPAIMKVGTRTLISSEAAAAWRRSCEIAAQQQEESTAARVSASVSAGRVRPADTENDQHSTKEGSAS